MRYGEERGVSGIRKYVLVSLEDSKRIRGSHKHGESISMVNRISIGFVPKPLFHSY